MKILLVIAGTAWVMSSNAASADCATASRQVERILCTDFDLMAQEKRLNALYAKTAAASDPESLRAQQRRWIEEVRNACNDRACLAAAYRTRIAELEASATGAAAGSGAGAATGTRASPSQPDPEKAQAAFIQAIAILKDPNGRFMNAVPLLRRSTELGSKDAPLVLANMFLSGWTRNTIVDGKPDVLKPIPDLALRLLEVAVRRGSVEALAMHAELLYYGKGTYVTQDRARAIAMYEEAARRGWKAAILQLSVVADDRNKRAPWYDVKPAELQAARAALARLQVSTAEQDRLVTDAEQRKMQRNEDAENERRLTRFINAWVRYNDRMQGR